MREMTVVRIPLRSAKHHFGVSLSRGSRPYNEDTHQAGTIEIPAFAKRAPISWTRDAEHWGKKEATSAESASGDPQVFYFGVFDGHGGNECSDWLREELHTYIEDSARRFNLESSLRRAKSTKRGKQDEQTKEHGAAYSGSSESTEAPKAGDMNGVAQAQEGQEAESESQRARSAKESQSTGQADNQRRAEELERELVNEWRETVGGYFKRFKPQFFALSAGGQGHVLEREVVRGNQLQPSDAPAADVDGVGIENVLTYAFLRADLDFIEAQAKKSDEDPVLADRALNEEDILDQPSRFGRRIGGPRRFKGGSTCSMVLISTPTPTPFWHPATPSSLVTAHVGDTRVLLCNTATGLAIPLTTDHHPSHPNEALRMRRFAATFVTDSFGEERVSGLANTRAFGDVSSKRVGVSAEPEIRRLELQPAEYSFLVLVSDGVAGTLSDQETVDIVKEARTPEQAARDIVSFATEVAAEADNATAVVVRLGGWERRGEGGHGSMGTKEMRNWRKQEAQNPRNRRT